MGQPTEQEWADFWAWARGGEIAPVPAMAPAAEDDAPGIFPSWSDWLESAVEANRMLRPSGAAAGGGALNKAATAFGASFGQLTGLAVLAGVGYLIFSREMARR